MMLDTFEGTALVHHEETNEVPIIMRQDYLVFETIVTFVLCAEN